MKENNTGIGIIVNKPCGQGKVLPPTPYLKDTYTTTCKTQLKDQKSFKQKVFNIWCVLGILFFVCISAIITGSGHVVSDIESKKLLLLICVSGPVIWVGSLVAFTLIYFCNWLLL